MSRAAPRVPPFPTDAIEERSRVVRFGRAKGRWAPGPAPVDEFWKPTLQSAAGGVGAPTDWVRRGIVELSADGATACVGMPTGLAGRPLRHPQGFSTGSPRFT